MAMLDKRSANRFGEIDMGAFLDRVTEIGGLKPANNYA
jgi:hypothetical protein